MNLPIEDRVALADLVHLYAARVDDRDFAGVAALFTDDGVLASPVPPRSLDPVFEAVGPVGVQAAMSQLTGIALTFHAVVGNVIEGTQDPDEARGRIQCVAHHVIVRDGKPIDLVWHVRYLDRYRRTDGAWRFSRRDLHVDMIEKRPLGQARTGDTSAIG